MEDVITISKSELQELVAKEVANRITKQAATRRSFGSVKIDYDDIEIVNRNHPEIFEKMKLPFYGACGSEVMPIIDNGKWNSNLGDTRSIYTTKRFLNKSTGAYYHRKRTLYASNIHEILRSLTLAVYGATLINDLDANEFEETLDLYNDFKQIFLDKYNQRLYKAERTNAET